MIRQLDFVAIGTNDLVQYTLAVDRNNNELGELYDPLHPAVLRLIAHTIAVCRRNRRPVTLCGEIAGDVYFTAMLIGLGLTEFSMHPGLILEVREVVNALHAGELRKIAPRLLRATDRAGIDAVMQRMRARMSAIVENAVAAPEINY